MNRELLAQVRDRIAAVGDDHCDMRFWAQGTVSSAGDPDCGTTACIAGYTIAMAYGVFTPSAEIWPEREARYLLDLPSSDLFHASCWPDRFQDLREDEGDAKAMLAIVDAILDGTVVWNGCVLKVIEDVDLTYYRVQP